MSDRLSNARRMVQLFEQMRETRPGPAFERLKQLNLSFSHLRMMRLLMPDQMLPMKELADQLGLTPPSVTALTRRLAQAGLVRRIAHAEDSRVALLSLTPAGRALHEQLSQEHVERMARLLQGLSEQEQQQFLDLLDRAVRALRDDVAQVDTGEQTDIAAEPIGAPPE